MIVDRNRRVTEFRVGIAERLRRTRERLEQRLQGFEAAGLGVGGDTIEPIAGIHTQNETVARMVIGICCRLWATGVWKRVTTYLNEISTPSGPEVTPPPPSAE